jgi:hypothetical protein
MSVLRILATVSVISCFALPAMAQTGSAEGKGGSYHYSGGPKSEVPYHPGEKKTVGQKKAQIRSAPSHRAQGRMIGGLHRLATASRGRGRAILTIL